MSNNPSSGKKTVGNFPRKPKYIHELNISRPTFTQLSKKVTPLGSQLSKKVTPLGSQVMPGMIELLNPVIETALEKGADDNMRNSSPGEVGVLVGHILASIDIFKIDAMMKETKW